MGDDVVLDASVAAKLFFAEELSRDARAAVRAAGSIIAPDLLFIELASVASKRVRRGTSPFEPARAAMDSIGALLDEAVPLADLSTAAFELAAEHGFSAYDAAYLALARARGLQLLTADERLVRRAREVGLGDHVLQLGEV